MEENRKKKNLILKMNLLNEFELTDEEKKNYRSNSPVTDTMKNLIT